MTRDEANTIRLLLRRAIRDMDAGLKDEARITIQEVYEIVSGYWYTENSFGRRDDRVG